MKYCNGIMLHKQRFLSMFGNNFSFSRKTAVAELNQESSINCKSWTAALQFLSSLIYGWHDHVC